MCAGISALKPALWPGEEISGPQLGSQGDQQQKWDELQGKQEGEALLSVDGLRCRFGVWASSPRRFQNR